MENPIAISNYFINKASSLGESLTPMKVLKLVYLAHGWFLGLNDGTSLIPEFAQAWKYGPVIQSVYDAFKQFKGNPIISLGIDSNTLAYPLVSDKNIVPFLDKIWDVYGKYTGLELSAITHQPGSPWDQVWNKEGGKDNLGVIIPNDVIANYYRKRVDA